MAAASSLKEYLKKYESSDAVKEKKKKKKKQKKTELMGVLVVDEDPVWQKPVILEEEKDDSADEEKPQVDEDIEVKRMKRLELLKSVRPYGVISEDGSGWVSVSDTPQKLNSDDHYADISPPRKHRHRNDTPSPEPTWKSSTETNDLSPPRQRRHYHTPSPEHETKPLDSLPPRKRAHNDVPSSERKSQCLKLDQTVSDFSPARRRSHDLDPDLSPPRRVPSGSANQGYSRSFPGEDLTPPRSRRGNIPRSPVEDLSPPRTSIRDTVASPKLDLSPPRNRRGNIPRSPMEDLSPPRKSRRDTVASPKPDLSPPRKSRKDLSPPRKIMKDSTSLTNRPKTGLVTGKDVKEEVLKTKNEAFLRFKAKDPSITGRGVEPVYRDKITGERLSKDQVLKLQKKEEKPKEIKLEWGKGLAQKREAEARMQELELEKEKPFARTRDDPDLDRIMKDRLRWGDPMAHLVKRKQPDVVLRDIGDDEKMKASGFIVPQEVPNHSWIKRRLDPAPNRYGIKPGRHWDGVDRSTGFEKAMFKRTNEKQATEREAYLWSVADM